MEISIYCNDHQMEELDEEEIKEHLGMFRIFIKPCPECLKEHEEAIEEAKQEANSEGYQDALEEHGIT